MSLNSVKTDSQLKLQQQQKLTHMSILPISTYLNVEKLRSLCRHSESDAGPRNVVTSETDVVVVTARVEEGIATFRPFALCDVGVETSTSEIRKVRVVFYGKGQPPLYYL